MGGISAPWLCVMVSEADETRQALSPEGRHASSSTSLQDHASLLGLSRSRRLKAHVCMCPLEAIMRSNEAFFFFFFLEFWFLVKLSYRVKVNVTLVWDFS